MSSLTKHLKRCKKSWFLIGVLVALFTLTCIMPEFAFAVSDEDPIATTDVEANLGTITSGDFFKYGLTKLIGGAMLDFAKWLTDIANEFFATITGNNLFTLGIEDDRFANVMLFVSNVCNALLPIGYLVLGIFAGVEGLRILKDTKSLSSQWLGLGVMEAWLVYAIKFTVLYVLITNAKALMLAIYSVVSLIQTAVSNAVSAAGFSDASTSFDSLTNLANAVTFEQGTGFCMIIVLVALLAAIVAALTAIYVQVLAVMRLFEIFILIAVSPVSISGLVSSYTSPVAAGYIKTFIGAVLQISILFLIVAIAGPILASVTGSINEIFASGTSAVESIVATVTPIVTTLAVFLMAKQSRQIADRLAGAA